MSTYTLSDIQRIIDDLDYAQALVSPPSDDPCFDELKRVKRSLKQASQILCDLDDAVLEALTIDA
jgi:hypothetical protein